MVWDLDYDYFGCHLHINKYVWKIACTVNSVQCTYNANGDLMEFRCNKVKRETDKILWKMQNSDWFLIRDGTRNEEWEKKHQYITYRMVCIWTRHQAPGTHLKSLWIYLTANSTQKYTYISRTFRRCNNQWFRGWAMSKDRESFLCKLNEGFSCENTGKSTTLYSELDNKILIIS